MAITEGSAVLSMSFDSTLNALRIVGMQGETGVQGDTGIRGLTGLYIQGTTGIQGVTGVIGITGETGVSAGATHTIADGTNIYMTFANGNLTGATGAWVIA